MSEEDTVIGHDVVTSSKPEATTTNARQPNQDVVCRGRGGKYSPTDLLSLFTIMEIILPIGPREWENVAVEHSLEFTGRDVDSIIRKYTSFH